MRLGLLDEDKELQNESDQLQMWKIELEENISKLKEDCLKCIKEFEQYKIWRLKVEEEIGLLCKLNNQVRPIPSCGLYCTSETVCDSKLDQKKFNASSDKALAKDGTSQTTYIFGSNEDSATFEFKFSKEIPNVKFTVFKNVENVHKTCEKIQNPSVAENVRKTYDKVQNSSIGENIRKKYFIDKIENRSIAESVDKKCDKIQNASITLKTKKKEKKDKKPEDVFKNDGTSKVHFTVLKNDKKKSHDETDWKSKLNVEVEGIKSNVLELKRQMQENSKWKDCVEKKISDLASIHRSCSTDSETNFVKLNKKIDENYLKIQESIAEVKLGVMSRSELICRLNDLKETIFDRFNQSDMKSSLIVPEHDKYISFNGDQQGGTKLKSFFGSPECDGGFRPFDCNTHSTSTPLTKEKINKIASGVEKRVISVGVNTSDDFDQVKVVRSEEENIQKSKDNDKINVPNPSLVTEGINKDMKSSDSEEKVDVICKAVQDLQASKDKVSNAETVDKGDKYITIEELKRSECINISQQNDFCTHKSTTLVNNSVQECCSVSQNYKDRIELHNTAVNKDIKSNYNEEIGDVIICKVTQGFEEPMDEVSSAENIIEAEKCIISRELEFEESSKISQQNDFCTDENESTTSAKITIQDCCSEFENYKDGIELHNVDERCKLDIQINETIFTEETSFTEESSTSVESWSFIPVPLSKFSKPEEYEDEEMIAPPFSRKNSLDESTFVVL